MVLAGCVTSPSSPDWKKPSYLRPATSISDDQMLCRFATAKGKWETDARFAEYVTKAKQLNLTCGVEN